MNPSAEYWSELLAGYVLGELTPAEIIAVEEYLATDPAAQAELSQLQNTLALVPMGLTGDAMEPPAQLRDRILLIGQPAINNATAPRRRQLLWVIGTAMIAAMSGLGWNNYRLDQQLQLAKQEISNQQATFAQTKNRLQLAQQEVNNQQAMLAQADNRLLSIASIDADGEYTSRGTTGSLVMSPKVNKAVLALQKVPMLPAGKVYRMWAIMDDEEMACADFVPDQQGQVSQTVAVKEWSKAKTVVITIEAAKESPIAEGEAVMMGGDKIAL
jgi:Anti-sigma-K factor rskA